VRSSTDVLALGSKVVWLRPRFLLLLGDTINLLRVCLLLGSGEFEEELEELEVEVEVEVEVAFEVSIVRFFFLEEVCLELSWACLELCCCCCCCCCCRCCWSILACFRAGVRFGLASLFNLDVMMDCMAGLSMVWVLVFVL